MSGSPSRRRDPDPLVLELLAARRALGWSQERLAHHAQVSVTTVRYLENGRSMPCLPVLRALARALRHDVVLQPREASAGGE